MNTKPSLLSLFSHLFLFFLYGLPLGYAITFRKAVLGKKVRTTEITFMEHLVCGKWVYCVWHSNPGKIVFKILMFQLNKLKTRRTKGFVRIPLLLGF